MRLEEDDSEGGHLEICCFSDYPRFQEVTAPDHAVEIVDPVMDQANTLIFMINSPYTLHGVSPRYPKPRIRRYLNFLAEFREPVFDLKPYQDDTTPWVLEQIGVDRNRLRDPFNRVNLLYLINIERIHMMAR